VGIVDDFLDSKENNNSKFSMLDKVRNISVEAAKIKIDNFRKHGGHLINASNNYMEVNTLDNVFVNSAKPEE